MKFKILTSGRLGKEFSQYLSEFENIACTYIADEEEAGKRINDFNSLAGFNFFDNADISHVKWIHSFGAGVENIIQNKSLNKNTLVTRTVGQMGRKMGEYCLAHTLYVLKRIGGFRKNQQIRRWEKLSMQHLYNKKALVFGTGGIGAGVADVFKHFVEEVHGINNSGDNNESFDNVSKLDMLSSIDFTAFDIIINALPHTYETEDLFNNEIFNRFDQSIFINVGRGASVNERHLLEALDGGMVDYAILDVFKNEPLEDSSGLWNHPKVMITPHQAARTDIEDVKMSFDKVYNDLTQGKRNELFVDLNRAY